MHIMRWKLHKIEKRGLFKDNLSLAMILKHHHNTIHFKTSDKMLHLKIQTSRTLRNIKRKL